MAQQTGEEREVTMEELRKDYAQIRGGYPIHHIESRVKTLPSIIKKLHSLDIPVSIINAKKNLHDIAGVRVVCRYVDDIYRIANLLLSQDDIVLILEKDYIKKPKDNGYRSLHIVVDVPVYMIDGKLFIPVEIQIRTVAMDFWATLEHGIRYKASEEVPPSIAKELRECADVITDTDYKMQKIFKTLQDLIHGCRDLCLFQCLIFRTEYDRISNGLKSCFDLCTFVKVK